MNITNEQYLALSALAYLDISTYYNKKQTTIGYLIGNNRIKDYLGKDGSVSPEFSASELETRRTNSACCRCLVHILSRARSATCLHIIITLGWRRCTRKSCYLGRLYYWKMRAMSRCEMKLLNTHERNLPGSEKRFLGEKVLAGMCQEKVPKPTNRQRKNRRS